MRNKNSLVFSPWHFTGVSARHYAFSLTGYARDQKKLTARRRQHRRSNAARFSDRYLPCRRSSESAARSVLVCKQIFHSCLREQGSRLEGKVIFSGEIQRRALWLVSSYWLQAVSWIRAILFVFRGPRPTSPNSLAAHSLSFFRLQFISLDDSP